MVLLTRAPDCLTAYKAEPETFRKLPFIVLTLVENLFTIYGFDEEKYTEQMVFAVFVIHPIIMATSGAVSRQTATEWDDLIVAILAEVTQTLLFVMFCDYDTMKSAFLFAILAVQLMLLFLDQNWDYLSCSRKGCSYAGLSISAIRADSSYKDELILLLFGAATSALPMLCKTGDTESRLANVTIEFFATKLFALVMTVFLWSLEVLAYEKTVDPLVKNGAWLIFVQAVHYYSLAYACLVALAALLSVGFILFPLVLTFFGIAAAVLLPLIPPLVVLAIVILALKILKSCYDCAESCRPRGVSSPFDASSLDPQCAENAFGILAKLAAAGVWGGGIFALVKYFVPFANFVFGCGGLLLGWSFINIAFISIQSADVERIQRNGPDLSRLPQDNLFVTAGEHKAVEDRAAAEAAAADAARKDARLKQAGHFQVVVECAHDLRAVDVTNTSDPYVVLKLPGMDEWTSKVVPWKVNPRWDEVASWPVSSLRALLPLTLILEVWDRNHLWKSKPLGDLSVELKPFEEVARVDFDHHPLLHGDGGNITFALVWKSDTETDELEV